MRTDSHIQRTPASVFISATIVIFVFTLSAADSIGFVPCYVDETCERVALSSLPMLGNEAAISYQLSADSSQSVSSVLPERIAISAIDLDLPVLNPATRDIATLDEYLKDGPVRYVDSAKLGEAGNTLIFAHTSHLPIVRNQMYKAFNRIPELVPGDSISLVGADGITYLYTVRSVRQADATEELIDLSKNGRRLTLVTCDTLTSKTSRFILEADFVGVL